MRHQVRTAVAVSVTATVTVAAGATVGGVPAAAAPGPTVYPTLTCVQPSTSWACSLTPPTQTTISEQSTHVSAAE